MSGKSRTGEMGGSVVSGMSPCDGWGSKVKTSNSDSNPSSAFPASLSPSPLS